MTLDWGWGKRLAARGAGFLGAVAAGVLAVVLAAHAARAERETLSLEKHSDDLRRAILQVRRESQSLRDEMRALETDPVYVESLLRRWKMAGSPERMAD